MPDVFSRRNLGPFDNHYLAGFGDAGIIRVLDNDFWIARSWVVVTDSPDLPGHPGTTANDDYRIRADADPPSVLTRVCMTGAGSGAASCGYVTETFHTDPQGVSALVRATYCRTGGDSGGPVFATNTAYGVHRGGYSDCDAYFTKAQVAEGLMNVDITHADD